jgi:hypothetical protein
MAVMFRRRHRLPDSMSILTLRRCCIKKAPIFGPKSPIWPQISKDGQDWQRFVQKGNK